MSWVRSPVVALVLGAALISAQASVGAQRGTPAAADRVLAEAVARREIPGVVAMAADRSGIIYQGAFGLADMPSGRPLAVDAIFRIASMTKPITSVAAVQLIAEGRLRLDDPAATYLPELANLTVFDRFDARTGEYTVRPAKRTLTVRHLLTHTGGFGYNFTSPIVRDFKPRKGEQYAAGPLLFEPGEQWLYGTNTDWVGRLVEVISGQTLEAYFRERIFGPLGMPDTFYNVPDGKLPRLVTVHHRRSASSFEVEANQPPVSVTRFNGGGGLASTAADYIRFLQMLLNGGTLNGARILSAYSVRLMGANHIGSVGVRALKTALPERSSDFSFVADGRDKWGLGFLITTDQRNGKRSAGSLSWGGINNTYFWVDPTRGIAGVILMQFLPFADSTALAVYDRFERAVYQLARPSTQ
jgi:CubicO group peptidase (beta-lactamase class C family)